MEENILRVMQLALAINQAKQEKNPVRGADRSGWIYQSESN